MEVPGPRTPAQRKVGYPLPLSRLLPKPIHYVLAGGGSHGAVQWGALQALSQTDLRPDAIIGTSAGALNGAILAEDLASAVSRIGFVWGQLDSEFVVGDKWLTRTVSQVRSAGLVSNAYERATLESILQARTFEDLDVPFAAVATDLANGRPHVFDSGPLIPALLASSAIPGVLPPVEIDGRPYVDGLASANLPAVPAVLRGARSLVVLDTGTRQAAQSGLTAAKVLARVGGIMAASQRRRQLREAGRDVPVLLLPTPDDLTGTMEFGETMRAGAHSYTMALGFLADLAARNRRALRPGLYARADDHGVSAELQSVLKVVPA